MSPIKIMPPKRHEIVISDSSSPDLSVTLFHISRYELTNTAERNRRVRSISELWNVEMVFKFLITRPLHTETFLNT